MTEQSVSSEPSVIELPFDRVPSRHDFGLGAEEEYRVFGSDGSRVPVKFTGSYHGLNGSGENFWLHGLAVSYQLDVLQPITAALVQLCPSVDDAWQVAKLLTSGQGFTSFDEHECFKALGRHGSGQMTPFLQTGGHIRHLIAPAGLRVQAEPDGRVWLEYRVMWIAMIHERVGLFQD